MVCEQVAVFPLLSVARQMRVIVLFNGHRPATMRSVKIMTGGVVQLSVAVGVPVFGGRELAVQSIEMFDGQEICGGTMSARTIFAHMLVQPAVLVTVTEYVPGVFIVMQFAVAPVFQR